MFRQIMTDFNELIQITEVRLVIWFAVLAALIAVAIYVVLKLRGHSSRSLRQPEEYLMDFREMHEKGALNEKEFKKLRSELSRQVQQKLSGAGDKD